MPGEDRRDNHQNQTMDRCPKSRQIGLRTSEDFSARTMLNLVRAKTWAVVLSPPYLASRASDIAFSHLKNPDRTHDKLVRLFVSLFSAVVPSSFYLPGIWKDAEGVHPHYHPKLPANICNGNMHDETYRSVVGYGAYSDLFERPYIRIDIGTSVQSLEDVSGCCSAFPGLSSLERTWRGILVGIKIPSRSCH